MANTVTLEEIYDNAGEPPVGYIVNDHPLIKNISLAVHEDDYFRFMAKTNRDIQSAGRGDIILQKMREKHKEREEPVPDYLSSMGALIKEFETKAHLAPHGVPHATFRLIMPDEDVSYEEFEKYKKVITDRLESKNVAIIPERKIICEGGTCRPLPNVTIQLRNVRDLKKALEVLGFDETSTKTITDTSQEWLSRYDKLKEERGFVITKDWPNPLDRNRGGQSK